MKRVCCICHFVMDPGDGADGRITHGYCDDCLPGVMEEIDAYFEKNKADADTSAPN